MAGKLANAIAFLALGIAILSLFKSCEANKLSYEANIISRTTELPYFKFSIRYTDKDDEIVIHNEGGKLRELEEPIVYLFWDITSDKALMDKKSIAVINYYNLGSRDPLLSGDVIATKSTDKLSDAITLIDEFKKIGIDNGLMLFFSVRKYIRLRYKDIYEELHDDVYEISPAATKKMSKNQGMALIEEYNNYNDKGSYIDMHNATAKSLYKKLAF